MLYAGHWIQYLICSMSIFKTTSWCKHLLISSFFVDKVTEKRYCNFPKVIQLESSRAKIRAGRIRVSSLVFHLGFSLLFSTTSHLLAAGKLLEAVLWLRQMPQKSGCLSLELCVYQLHLCASHSASQSLSFLNKGETKMDPEALY